MFAKVGAMHILGAFLGQGRIVMTPAIHFMRDIIERGKVMYEAITLEWLLYESLKALALTSCRAATRQCPENHADYV